MINRRKFATMVAAATLTAGLSTGVVSAAAQTSSVPAPTTAEQGAPADQAVMRGQVGYLKAKHSGKCLTVNGNSQAKGAVVNQYTCLNRSNQRWTLLYTGTDGLAYVVAEHSGKCMDVQGGSKAKGAKIIQWDCNTRKNQTFRMRNLTGYISLKPLHAGGRMCLDIPGASQQQNAPAVLWSCNSHSNQQFKWVTA